jgi:hypothetical protein
MYKGFLYMTVTGDFVCGTVPEGFYEEIETARKRGLRRLLCDITRLAGLEANRTTVMDRFMASERVAFLFPTDFSVAFLAKPEQMRADRFGETVMLNRGLRVKVTTNLDEALKWLGVR